MTCFEGLAISQQFYSAIERIMPYTYDNANQLLTIDSPSGSTTFAYDANGNMTGEVRWKAPKGKGKKAPSLDENRAYFYDFEGRVYSSWVDEQALAVDYPIPSGYPEMVVPYADNPSHTKIFFDDIRIGHGPIVADNTPPESYVNPIEPYWQVEAPFTVTATASDDLSGVASVELWYRYSLDNWTDAVRWKKRDWENFGFGTENADNKEQYYWRFDAPHGYGYYEFVSVATDRAGNEENKERALGENLAEARCFVGEAKVNLALIPINTANDNIRGDRSYFTEIGRKLRSYYVELNFGKF